MRRKNDDAMLGYQIGNKEFDKRSISYEPIEQQFLSQKIKNNCENLGFAQENRKAIENTSAVELCVPAKLPIG